MTLQNGGLIPAASVTFEKGNRLLANLGIYKVWLLNGEYVCTYVNTV